MGLFGNKNSSAEENPSADASSGGRGSATPGTQDQANRGKGPLRTAAKPSDGAPSSRENAVATIGKSIIFKGELSGSEDLEVNGTVEGDVKLPDNTLIVGQSGHVKASIAAKSILIVGRVTGDVTATERIEIEASGIVEGDLRAPRLLVKEGAVMNGSVEMTGASKSLDGDKSSAARSDAGSSASTTSTTSTTSTSTSSTAAPRSQASAD